jgi:hypothetical protein
MRKSTSSSSAKSLVLERLQQVTKTAGDVQAVEKRPPVQQTERDGVVDARENAVVLNNRFAVLACFDLQVAFSSQSLKQARQSHETTCTTLLYSFTLVAIHCCRKSSLLLSATSALKTKSVRNLESRDSGRLT